MHTSGRQPHPSMYMNKHTQTINIYTLTFKDFVAQSAHQVTKQPPALPTARHQTPLQHRACLTVTPKSHYHHSRFSTAGLTRNLHGVLQAETEKRKQAECCAKACPRASLLPQPGIRRGQIGDFSKWGREEEHNISTPLCCLFSTPYNLPASLARGSDVRCPERNLNTILNDDTSLQAVPLILTALSSCPALQRWPMQTCVYYNPGAQAAAPPWGFSLSAVLGRGMILLAQQWEQQKVLHATSLASMTFTCWPDSAKICLLLESIGTLQAPEYF